MTDSRKRHPIVLGVALFLFNLCVYALVIALMLFHPRTQLPAEWHPGMPLRVDEPFTPLTSLRLRWATRDPAICQAALRAHRAQITLLPPLLDTENCTIPNRVAVTALGDAVLERVETSCAAALRLAMWERHSLQPAARGLLSAEVTRISHFGSYSCRQMRTSRGVSTRWSSHATAEALDVSGVTLSDGRTIDLLRDWNGTGPEALFLQRVNREACRWFPLVLGPNYNALHKDHFHLQSTGWGLCR